MKSILLNRVFLSLFFFSAGLGVAFAYEKNFSQLKSPVASESARVAQSPAQDDLEAVFDGLFNDDFFRQSGDPFTQMRRMREQMLKNFPQPNGAGSPFDSWFEKKFGGGSVAELNQREDDKFVYYDIAIQGLAENKVKVNVSDGQVEISGEVTKKSESGNQASVFTSTFHRSIPVPVGVDANKAELNQEKDRIVVKFPKLAKRSEAV